MTKFTRHTFDAREKRGAPGEYVRVGMSTCGLAAGAGEVYRLLEQGLRDRGVTVPLQQCGCAGQCYAEPLVEVKRAGMDPAVYCRVDADTVAKILDTHLVGGKVITERTCAVSPKERRVVLRNCGVIDPASLDDYLDRDGYAAVRKALFDMKPEQVIDELKTSGLRGRGGAGFPTWLKWSLARKATGDEKFVICNGDEGDPGAYMDRSVLESDPHSVLEGMILGAYAMGATQGYAYIRAEYPLAIQRVQQALQQAREAGLLGPYILGSAFSFDIEIRLGAGAFVCGEETALMASIEGMRGTPTPRPPFPTDRGLWGKPSSINNVETFANIAPIIHRGGAWFAAVGTEKSKGTKVFALTGKVARSGLVEIPMGTPLRDIVFEIGGGAASGRQVLAIQTGGPSGGMIPRAHFDTPVSFEHLQALGSIMGSGGMIVMDEDDCIVDIAKFYLGFCVEESCGKCAPCRIGGKQMLDMLDKITRGAGEQRDLDRLKAAALAMQKASLCGLGQSAPNPVVSSLRFFEQEYHEHIHGRKCRAKRCAGLLQYSIIDESCKRCGLCLRQCPASAISGDRTRGFVIDPAKCIRCGRCFEVCKFDAIAKG